MIINAGLKTVYYQEGYADELSEQMLSEVDITLIHMDDHAKEE